MNKIFHILVLTSAYCAHLYAPLTIGDSNAAAGETFSFDIGFASFDPGSDKSAPRLWVASSDPAMNTLEPSVQQYGLSFINQLPSYVAPGVQPVAIPMASPENATVYAFNGTSGIVSSIPNPIWGGTFAFFDVSVQKPVFTVTSNLSAIYAVENLVHYPVTTESQQNITELLVHDFSVTTPGDQVQTLLASGNEIYAAHAVGTFGTDATSKITLLSRSKFTSEQGIVPYLQLIADTSITVDTPALYGGAPLTPLLELCPSVTISNIFGQVYVGVDATASLGSCAAGIVIAQLASNGSGGFLFQFGQIAPTSVLNPGYDTVISASSCNEIRIKNIAGMRTSTALDYLIVARDNGAAPQTIYAVPLVTTGVNAGMVADFTSVQNYFNTVNPTLFSSRQFTAVISDATQIDPAGAFSAQLSVGAGALPLDSGNSIQSLYTVGDSVYAVIGDAYTLTQSPGTWRSQAIFAQDGHIIGWSPWSRVLGSDEQMNYSFVDRKTISGFYVAHVTTNFRAVEQTTFVADSNLAPFLTVAQGTPGSIQGIFDFPQSTPGFNNAISLLISTGYNNVTIGQTGALNGGIFEVLTMTSADVISFNSSDLHTDNGAFVACDIAHNGVNNWIFVGGINGVSVLTGDSTGYSWTGNLANVAALNAGQTWKTVGDFSSVKKLVWDQTYIYILTSTQLYQIALDPNKFLATPTVNLGAQLIASSADISQNSYFLDMIIDNGFILLGTTNGLYSLTLGSKQITQIQIPNGLPAISTLIAVSSSLQPQRNFKTLSNLLVLNNSFGSQQARLNRFVISNSVLTPFDDFLNAGPNGSGVASSFIKFDNYMSNYFTDGTWNLASSYFLGVNQPLLPNVHLTPLVQQIFAGVKTGFSSSQIIMPMLSSYAPLPFTYGTNNLAGFVQESVAGSLILFGNFAAQANV